MIKNDEKSYEANIKKSRKNTKIKTEPTRDIER